MKNFINRALVAKKKLKLFFAFRDARPPCEPGSEERGVCLRPKNSDFLVVKTMPFLRQFSTIFSFIFSPSSAYLRLWSKLSQRFAYHSISTSLLMVASRKAPFQAATVTYRVVMRW